jgi:hypothetical protein
LPRTLEPSLWASATESTLVHLQGAHPCTAASLPLEFRCSNQLLFLCRPGAVSLRSVYWFCGSDYACSTSDGPHSPLSESLRGLSGLCHPGSVHGLPEGLFSGLPPAMVRPGLDAPASPFLGHSTLVRVAGLPLGCPDNAHCSILRMFRSRLDVLTSLSSSHESRLRVDDLMPGRPEAG